MRSTAITLAAFGLVLAPTCAPAPAAAERAAAAAPAVRTFELTYRAVIDGLPEDAREVRLWLPYPTDDESQEVEVTEVSSPYPTRVAKEPEHGNSVLYLAVADPETNPITVEMKARVRRTEKIRKDFDQASSRRGGEPPAELAMWLEPDRLVPLDERIRTLAAEVTAGKETDLEKARAIYDYVVDTMSYDKSGTGWGRGDIYWACDMKAGNCTDFHALFTGLNRAVGIPAKFAIGFPIPPDRAAGEIGGYHCWAEFWLDGYGWVPVDTSEARKHPDQREYFFGAHDENRVELTEGRDLVLAPEQSGEPLNFFVYPYVEVDGKPWEGVSQSFRYRDIDGGAGPDRPGS
jgi:transglutaminase-like putative cysteine protease